jgi:hypothetical protein
MECTNFSPVFCFSQNWIVWEMFIIIVTPNIMKIQLAFFNMETETRKDEWTHVVEPIDIISKLLLGTP